MDTSGTRTSRGLSSGSSEELGKGDEKLEDQHGCLASSDAADLVLQSTRQVDGGEGTAIVLKLDPGRRASDLGSDMRGCPPVAGMPSVMGSLILYSTAGGHFQVGLQALVGLLRRRAPVKDS